MKKTILAFLLLCFIAVCNAQTWSLNAYQSAYKTKSYGEWSDWTEWFDCDIDITVSSRKISIYTQDPQYYAVIQLLSQEDNTWKWQCSDKNGTPCIIRFVIDTDGNQLYVDYSDAKLVYNIKLIQ